MKRLSHVIVTVSGPDHPGITARLTGLVAEADAELLDVEQVVVHGQLTLALLVAIGGITVETAEVMARAGADFVAVSGGIWSYHGGAAAAVKLFNQKLNFQL